MQRPADLPYLCNLTRARKRTAEPCQQHFLARALGDEIVGAKSDPTNLIGFRIFGSEKNNRYKRVKPAYLFADRKSV